MYIGIMQLYDNPQQLVQTAAIVFTLLTTIHSDYRYAWIFVSN